MIVNFRTHGINPGMHKLAQIPILIKKIIKPSFYLLEDWFGKWASSTVVAKIILSFPFVFSKDLKLIIIN